MRTLIWLVVLLGSVPAAAVAYDPLVAGSHWAARDYVTVVLQHPGEEILVVVAPLLEGARRPAVQVPGACLVGRADWAGWWWAVGGYPERDRPTARRPARLAPGGFY